MEFCVWIGRKGYGIHWSCSQVFWPSFWVQGISFICGKTGLSIGFPLANEMWKPILASPLTANLSFTMALVSSDNVLGNALGVATPSAEVLDWEHGAAENYPTLTGHVDEQETNLCCFEPLRFEVICFHIKKDPIPSKVNKQRVFGHMQPGLQTHLPPNSSTGFFFALSPSLLISLFVSNIEIILLEDRL